MPSHFPKKSRGSDLNLLVFDASTLVEVEDQKGHLFDFILWIFRDTPYMTVR